MNLLIFLPGPDSFLLRGGHPRKGWRVRSLTSISAWLWVEQRHWDGGDFLEEAPLLGFCFLMVSVSYWFPHRSQSRHFSASQFLLVTQQVLPALERITSFWKGKINSRWKRVPTALPNPSLPVIIILLTYLDPSSSLGSVSVEEVWFIITPKSLSYYEFIIIVVISNIVSSW